MIPLETPQSSELSVVPLPSRLSQVILMLAASLSPKDLNIYSSASLSLAF